MKEKYLYHYGIKGMKWGVRRKKTKLEKEKRALMNDAKSLTVKAKSGTHLLVTGQYMQKRGGRAYMAHHLVDEFGKVKLSYINGVDGHRYLAAGKKYIKDNVNLNEYFRNAQDMNIEYNVYK